MDIHREVVSMYGTNTMSVQMVRKRCSASLEGRQNVIDEPRSGRPSTATEGEAVQCVKEIVKCDEYLTLDDIVSAIPPRNKISRR